MEAKQCTCNNNVRYVIQRNKNHIGLYCYDCGKWLKWLNKQEVMWYSFQKHLDVLTKEENI